MKQAIVLAVFVLLAVSASARVWINEFESNPASGLSSDEWIELCSDEPYVLDGCTLTENNGYITSLSGTVDGCYVIDDPKGMLNNDADFIQLDCPAASDRVDYNPGPAKGKSLGLNELGEWQEYDMPTKGLPNFEQAPEDQVPGEDDEFADGQVPEFTPLAGAIALIASALVFGVMRKARK